MIKTIDVISKYQKILLAMAIFLALFAVSITIDSEGVNLTLNNYPSLMLLLVAISITLAIIYIRIDKHRIQSLTLRIQSLSNKLKDSNISTLSELTSRQREVYQLILSGKSNKEIMAELFIEQSTLKSHINQIYKKLNIKSRKELKSKAHN